jgi:hypothetical protein
MAAGFVAHGVAPGRCAQAAVRQFLEAHSAAEPEEVLGFVEPEEFGQERDGEGRGVGGLDVELEFAVGSRGVVRVRLAGEDLCDGEGGFGEDGLAAVGGGLDGQVGGVVDEAEHQPTVRARPRRTRSYNVCAVMSVHRDQPRLSR